MKFIDLQQQRVRLGAELKQRMDRVLAHGQFILGPEVAELERELSRRTGGAEVISCASGTDALALALRALGAGVNDAVFLPSFTYAATASAIVRVGATPVFVDLADGGYQMCQQDLTAALSEVDSGTVRGLAGEKLRSWGAIAVSLFGLPAQLSLVRPLLGERELIEDGAQSLFARQGDQISPARTRVGTTSFFPSKVLGCFGDGGAIFCKEPALAQRLRRLRTQGKPSADQQALEPGENSRLDTLQAAVLLAKLTIADEELRLRSQCAQRYHQLLAGLDEIELMRVPREATCVWSSYTVRLRTPAGRQREAILSALSNDGIPVRIYYESALHEQPAFAPYRAGRSLTRSEHTARSVFSLPLHPYLSEIDQTRVFESLRKALSGRRSQKQSCR